MPQLHGKTNWMGISSPSKPRSADTRSRTNSLLQNSANQIAASTLSPVPAKPVFLLYSTLFHLKLISLPSQHLPLIFIPTTFLAFSSITSSFIIFQYSFIYVSSRHGSRQLIPISLELFFSYLVSPS